MYSVVLLMSMTAAPEAPSFHGRLFHGCHGSSCHGCWSSCHGCCGGVTTHKSCHGCCGGMMQSCYGCVGGAGYGGGLWTTAPIGPYTNYYPTYTCHGYGVYGGATFTWPTPYFYGANYPYGYPAVPVYPLPKIEDKKGTDSKEEPKKTFLPASPDQARVIVHLPVDAKLYANGQLTTLTSGQRDFSTPVIPKGQDFQYAMKVEYVRDGKTITDNKVVRVRAGEATVVEFADETRVAMVTSKVTVALPQGAKLYVDDQPREFSTGVKEFQTPELQKGSQYAYTFRAELVKDGKNQTQSQRVVFKAGEPINVDFTEMDVARTASK